MSATPPTDDSADAAPPTPGARRPAPASPQDEGATASAQAQAAPQPSLSLFWRTFFLLALLLLGSLAAWLQIFRTFESQPHAVESARQLASLVSLSRASLRYSDAIARVSLIKTLADEEGLRIVPRQPGDRFRTLDTSGGGGELIQELRKRLGASTVLAESVNGESGFWVGFSIESDAYWLKADDARLEPSRKSTWLIWLLTAGLLSLLGAALIARVLNRPLKQLSLAMSRLRDGQFDPQFLDEQAATTEVRQVNAGFNRMAEQLSKVEHDRAIMLAGISHDLRTPLARLRLDTEMSVGDENARHHMAADIEQLDAIIAKFVDYARPQAAKLERVALAPMVERAVFTFSDDSRMRFNVDLPPGLLVLADPVELLRVLSNLLENARRYGKSEDGITRVDIKVSATKAWVLITLSDHGRGVASDVMRKLTRPFFRADESGDKSSGSGLGLAIVEASILRMGGGFSLSHAESGGLCANIRLRRA